jgi:pSer/pThr/pTyr-binding forkhead associated (FHA) protein
MKGFTQCTKGHFFNDDLTNCPYCPKGNTQTNTDAPTEFIGGDDSETSTSVSTEKTQIFGGNQNADSGYDPTIKIPDNLDTTKTIIGGQTNNTTVSGSKPTSRRKLRGWLVTYDNEEFGMDYKIVEGRNNIGKKASCDITVHDGQVTGSHALILCRNDKFIISDEMSTNGTLLNGNDLTPRETYDLKDGDSIRVGNTTLLFKTAF